MARLYKRVLLDRLSVSEGSSVLTTGGYGPPRGLGLGVACLGVTDVGAAENCGWDQGALRILA